MADFKEAIPHILKWEGGYSNIADDKGGVTYAGISRKNNPNWTGWKTIDALPHPPKTGALLPDLQPSVNALYKVNYWNKIIGDKIQNQGVATFLFDWFVNSGYHAIEGAQRVTGSKVDGVMGNGTLAAINNYKGDFKAKLIEERTAFVNRIVKNSPVQAKFLKGWLNRINSYK